MNIEGPFPSQRADAPGGAVYVNDQLGINEGAAALDERLFDSFPPLILDSSNFWSTDSMRRCHVPT